MGMFFLGMFAGVSLVIALIVLAAAVSNAAFERDEQMALRRAQEDPPLRSMHPLQSN